jgi:hypothetical protein
MAPRRLQVVGCTFCPRTGERPPPQRRDGPRRGPGGVEVAQGETCAHRPARLSAAARGVQHTGLIHASSARQRAPRVHAREVDDSCHRGDRADLGGRRLRRGRAGGSAKQPRTRSGHRCTLGSRQAPSATTGGAHLDRTGEHSSAPGRAGRRAARTGPGTDTLATSVANQDTDGSADTGTHPAAAHRVGVRTSAVELALEPAGAVELTVSAGRRLLLALAVVGPDAPAPSRGIRLRFRRGPPMDLPAQSDTMMPEGEQ